MAKTGGSYKGRPAAARQYVLHIWRGVEAKVVPVRSSVKATLAKMSVGEQDSVHLLEISAAGIPKVSDFSVGELEAAGISQP